MDFFGTCLTHVQTCDYVRVQSATQWTASVHALHMSKPVITFVFKVLRNGLLRSPTSGSEVHKVHRLGLLAILLGPVAAPALVDSCH